MIWVCRSCGREATHIRTIVDGDELVDQCDHPDCGNLAMASSGVPDVYLKRAGQTFENLCDDMGRPYEIQSKRHKKEIMDRLGVSEAGGTFNGAPYGSKSWIEGSRDVRRKQFAEERPKIQKIIREWRERNRASR